MAGATSVRRWDALLHVLIGGGRSMLKLNFVLLILFLAVLGSVTSCAERSTINMKKGEITCATPPKELDNPQVKAEADILVPQIGQLLKGKVSAEAIQQRVRQELHPQIANWEVIDYRLCLQYASGVLTADQYRKFTSQVLPTLQEVSPPSVTQKTRGANSPAVNGTHGDVNVTITSP